MTGPHGRARVNVRAPEAFGQCDRCNFRYNLKDLTYQYQWAGVSLINLRLRVCRECLDIPQIQLKTIILPADPVPVRDPRIEYYGIEVTSFLQSEEGPSLLTETGQSILWEIDVTPNNDPNTPVLIP